MRNELYFELGLGTRLRRLVEMFSSSGEQLYSEEDVSIKVGHFYAIYAVHMRGPQTINDIAEAAGFSHSAVSQTVKKLVSMGIFSTEPTDDARQKKVVLTENGKATVQKLEPIWGLVNQAVKDAISESGHDFLAAVTALEDRLKISSIYDRVHEMRKAPQNSAPYAIKPFDKKWRGAFQDLNMRWIKKYFGVEEPDRIMLADPEGTILDKGGEIFFAVVGDKAIGTIAMKHTEKGIFELTKLAVDPDAQQGGIGTALCEAVIERFVARGGKTLFLETNTILKPALRLYEKLNFVAKPAPHNSPYSRSNHYMEWVG